jgi:hypothetical protein
MMKRNSLRTVRPFKTVLWLGYVAVLLPSTVFAQSPAPDFATQALNAAFSRDNGTLLCLDRGYTASELRIRLEPFIRDIDATKEDSFRSLITATYDAFPCPFSPVRPELERAKPEDVVGRWVFAEASIALRHGPKSPAWKRAQGVPPIKCEAVVMQPGGAYRVVQVMGNVPCPEGNPELLSKLEQAPQVAAWHVLTPGRLRVDRSDVPGHFEEWDVFAVRQPFEIGRFKFSPGDLLTYLRRDPKNEIHAATMFRHLQPIDAGVTSMSLPVEALAAAPSKP